MRSFGVVPEKPGNQLPIELIGEEQQLFMVINKFFLDGSIKPFHMGIHLGSLGIGMPVVFVEPAQFLIEMLHELRTIVGKDRLKRIGKDLGNDPEELSSCQGGMALGSPGEGESRVVIGKRDHITSDAV